MKNSPISLFCSEVIRNLGLGKMHFAHRLGIENPVFSRRLHRDLAESLHWKKGRARRYCYIIGYEHALFSNANFQLFLPSQRVRFGAAGAGVGLTNWRAWARKMAKKDGLARRPKGAERPKAAKRPRRRRARAEMAGVTALRADPTTLAS